MKDDGADYESHDAAHCREQHAFGEQLPYDSKPPGAQRGADRELTRPAGRSSE